jgi:hypothetical protein
MQLLQFSKPSMTVCPAKAWNVPGVQASQMPLYPNFPAAHSVHWRLTVLEPTKDANSPAVHVVQAKHSVAPSSFWNSPAAQTLQVRWLVLD